MAEYRLRVCIGYNDDGSPIMKRISASNETELADKAAHALLSSERRSEFVQDAIPELVEKKAAPTFKEYAEHWLEVYKKPNLKHTSLDTYVNSLSKLYPTIGNTSLDKIILTMIQELLNDLAAQGIARSTIDKVKLTVKQVLQSAKEDGLIPENVADTKRLKNPSNIVNERDALSDEHYFDILKNIPKLQPQDQALIGLFAYAGMRRGEALGLRWENVDFDNNIIRIRDNATYPRSQNDAVLTTPKTKKSVRDLSITEPLRVILRQLEMSGQFVIGGMDAPITKSSYTKRIARINKKGEGDNGIDLYGATAHIFRHTYGTFLAYNGVGAIDLTEIMGHEDISTTMKIYVHVKMDSVRDAEHRAASLLMDATQAAMRVQKVA